MILRHIIIVEKSWVKFVTSAGGPGAIGSHISGSSCVYFWRVILSKSLNIHIVITAWSLLNVEVFLITSLCHHLVHFYCIVFFKSGGMDTIVIPQKWWIYPRPPWLPIMHINNRNRKCVHIRVLKIQKVWLYNDGFHQ